VVTDGTRTRDAPASWPQVRAGLIAIAVAFGLVDGCPLPTREKTPAWERGFVEPVRAAQLAVLAPVRWMRPILRIHQRWALYQAPRPDRFRLWIEGADRAGSWHLVFRAADPEHAELADEIEYSRPRGAWDPTSVPPSQFPLFASWASLQVLTRHPEYVAVRVRFEKVRLGTDGVTPTGEFVFEQHHERTP